MSIIKDGLKHFFNKMFKMHNQEQQKGRGGGVHASDMIRPEELYTGKMAKFDNRFCYRECVLKSHYRVTEREAGEYFDRIFLQGWFLHIKYQTLLEKYAKVKAIEKTVYNDKYIPIWFTPDAIITFMGKDMIVEIKGYKAEEADKLDEEGPAPESAEIQAQLYMHLTGIKHSVILVENKNTQVFKIWHRVYDETKILHIIERFEKLKIYLSRWEENPKDLPPRICANDRCDRANKCSVKDACFETFKNREADWLLEKAGEDEIN